MKKRIKKIRNICFMIMILTYVFIIIENKTNEQNISALKTLIDEHPNP